MLICAFADTQALQKHPSPSCYAWAMQQSYLSQVSEEGAPREQNHTDLLTPLLQLADMKQEAAQLVAIVLGPEPRPMVVKWDRLQI